MKQLTSILVIIMFIMVGCVREVEKEVEKIVNAWCLGFLITYSWQEAYLFSDPIEDIGECDAILKWDGNQTVFEDKGRAPWFAYFLDTTISCTPGIQYTLEITSESFGKSSGSVTIPEHADIIAPEDGDTLPMGDVEILWRQSANADFYGLWIDIEYFNSAGGWLGEKDIDTFVTDTSFTILAYNFQFPEAVYCHVSVGVFPYSGSLYEANMAGDFKGHLVGESCADYSYFYVGTPVLLSLSKCYEMPTVEERIEKIKKFITQRTRYSGDCH